MIAGCNGQTVQLKGWTLATQDRETPVKEQAEIKQVSGQQQLTKGGQNDKQGEGWR